MTLIALKPISIGEHVFQYGEPITAAAQRELPPGRQGQLVSHGYLGEIVDEVANSHLVERLAQRVEVLEAEVANLRTLYDTRLRPKTKEG